MGTSNARRTYISCGHCLCIVPVTVSFGKHGDDIGNHAEEEHPFGGATGIGFCDFPGVRNHFRILKRGAFPMLPGGIWHGLHLLNSFPVAPPASWPVMENACTWMLASSGKTEGESGDRENVNLTGVQ